MKTQFTVGPWKIVNAFSVGAGQFIAGSNGVMVVEICNDEHYMQDKEVQANAALIAAAPEMLEALKIADAYIVALYQDAKGSKIPSNHSLRTQLLEVIAKAEGRDE